MYIERFQITSQLLPSAILVSIQSIESVGLVFGLCCYNTTVVLCILVGCSNRSGRDKGVSFYRIPVVRSAAEGRSPKEVELSKARRAGFLAVISRDDLTESKLENERICSRHFIFGKPADLFDELNTDWLPTQHLRPIPVVHVVK